MDKNHLQKLRDSYLFKYNIKNICKTFKLPEEQVLRLAEAFDLFDVQEKGYLTKDELMLELEELKMSSKSGFINQYLDGGKVNSDGEGVVEFEDFVRIFGCKTDIKSKKDVETTFKLILGDNCDNNNNKICVDNFEKICDDLGIYFNKDEFQEMISLATKNNSNEMSFDDFYNLMMKYSGN